MEIQVSEAGSSVEEEEIKRKPRRERRAIEGTEKPRRERRATEATEKKGLKDPPAHQAEIPDAAGNAASWKLRILPSDRGGVLGTGTRASP